MTVAQKSPSKLSDLGVARRVLADEVAGLAALFAPPAILFFDASGQEQREFRMVGFMDADEFQQHVNKALP